MPYTKEEQREYNKQYRATRRKLKLCEYCGKKDEQTMNGKCYCRECAKKIKIRNSTGEARAKAKKNVFERHNKFKAEHRCSRCGTELKEGYNFIMCPKCQEISRNNYYIRKEKIKKVG